MIDTVLADRIREILAGRDPNDPFITYQALASALGLQPPGMIQRVTASFVSGQRYSSPMMKRLKARGIRLQAPLALDSRATPVNLCLIKSERQAKAWRRTYNQRQTGQKRS